MKNLPSHRQQLLFISPGLLLIVVFFAAGIYWAHPLHLPAQFMVCGVLFLLGLLFIIHKRKLKHLRTLSFFLLGLLFFLLGLQYAQTRMASPADPQHVYNLIGTKQTVTLDGVLHRYPPVIETASGHETRLIMQVKAILQPAGPNSLRYKNVRAWGLVQLTLKGLLPEELLPGDRFLVKANVSGVDTFSTPGSFNYKKHLANQAILIKGWIQSPHNIIELRASQSSLLTSAFEALIYLPERIRCHIAGFLDKTLTQPARGLYKAILIGDRSDVPAAVLDNFTGAGCIHILAISGMHMGLLAFVTIAVFTWLLKRSTWLLLETPVLKVAVSIALLPLLLYALIAGFNIPVLRALLMTSVFILALLFDRPGNLINHILLAALLILAWKPGALFTASFQLSFGAVIAIALIYPLLHRFLFQEMQNVSPPSTKPGPSSLFLSIPGFFLKWFLAGFALTAAAMLGTLPLLLFHFNRVSLVAPLSNLLVEPIICFWALIVGLLASISIPLLPALAKFLFAAGSYGLIAAERICAFFSALPNAYLWLPTPSPLEISLAYLFLLSSVITFHLPGRQRYFSLLIAVSFLSALVAAPAVSTMAKKTSGSAAVTFLDVGHGSSVLLQLPDNKNILIDGGGAGSDRFNIGARVIGPFLWNQKLSHLDAVVITHPHADHYNGLPFILNRFRPKELWINGIPGADSQYRELLDLAGQLNIKTRIAQADDVLFQAGTTRLLCLHSGRESAYPSVNFKQDGVINPNDFSIVLRLEINNKFFLFPADISAVKAEELVKEGKKLEADVLMAPHHGSASSMSQGFIETVAPVYIAISAGRNSPFNFPAKSFYDLQQQGIRVFSTGRDGTITFKVEDEGIMVSRYQVN